jgi:hypothetical protein
VRAGEKSRLAAARGADRPHCSFPKRSRCRPGFEEITFYRASRLPSLRISGITAFQTSCCAPDALILADSV